MKIKDFMTTNIVSINESDTVINAANLMIEKKMSVLPVVDDHQQLVGIITETDFTGADANIPHAMASIKRILGELHYFGGVEDILKRSFDKKISKVMTKNPVVVSPEDTLSNLVQLMGSFNIKRVPVVFNKKLVGIVTRKDVIKAFVQMKKNSN